MTSDQIRIECAKLDGWEYYNDPKDNPHCASQTHRWFDGKTGCCSNGLYDDYADSYDSIIPLIQKQDDDTYESLAAQSWYDNNKPLIRLTPLELCIALLKTKGLYHD